jgi:hypothetical protein
MHMYMPMFYLFAELLNIMVLKNFEMCKSCDLVYMLCCKCKCSVFPKTFNFTSHLCLVLHSAFVNPSNQPCDHVNC